MGCPEVRLRNLNERPVDRDGAFVLYWMTAARRTRWSFGLERAVERARDLGRPLVVLEALRAGHRYANDRLHRFVLEGMAANRARLTAAGVLHHPYVEPEPGAGRGLLAALAQEACLVVTDDFPCYFLPRMAAAAGQHLGVRLEAVDSNGLLPMRAADRVFPTAYAFRRFLQRELPAHLAHYPVADPLDGAGLVEPGAAPEALDRWPAAGDDLLAGDAGAIGRLPIDHGVPPAPLAGGAEAAESAWRVFLNGGLDRYDEDRNHPDRNGSSGLSAYLHFGHIASHQIASELWDREDWSPDLVVEPANGRRSGWWGLSEPAEAFLDQLVTWRELGLNFCSQRDGYDRYESLPDWARRTLAEHERDPRPHVYALEELEAAETHDELWNAAQRELRREGRIHNYLRMLWGKKILEWSATPRDALDAMIALNDRWALDGRDPNSYSGICWVLGRYDRAWGPERPIFGKIRYMTSDSTRKKLNVREYLQRFGTEPSLPFAQGTR